jgi:hypothetical protein
MRRVGDSQAFDYVNAVRNAQGRMIPEIFVPITM